MESPSAARSSGACDEPSEACRVALGSFQRSVATARCSAKSRPAAGRAVLRPDLVVFELRHRLDLILGRIVDRVIGIPLLVGRARGPVARATRRAVQGARARDGKAAIPQ